MTPTTDQLAALRAAAEAAHLPGVFWYEQDMLEKFTKHFTGTEADAVFINSASPAAILSLLDRIDAQAAELAEWHKLRDSNALHINLLRGMPARLTAEQLLHIAGDEYQRMATRISELELFLGAQSAERNIDSWPEWKRRLVRDIGGFSSIISDRSRDATRYRWLRDSRRLPDEMDGTIIVGVACGESILSDEQLDASIDAAMALQCTS
ncbi:hypothetical protein [Chromobacterium violaceum]|uniref:Uncharacterized protein n=1 Tax=Chromobacterium violaceum TaxID=536 RepID=A0A202BCY2_CHRVL|nr:hypothetical protein [Chromobacterium violaceum]OVE49407.1 hypothetical protein CBW21_05860 [Chromobacterium violaceum]